MTNSHLNIVIPQWQGGGQDLSTYNGGMDIKNNYLQEINHTEIQISCEVASEEKYNILGYEEIFKQLSDAKIHILEQSPETIFTIGGGCDSDIISIGYLNKMAKGDMTLLYLDAHGDLNTPESSESKFFYGMPLRTLLNDGNKKILDLLPSTLLPSQVIMLGIRDLDKAEAQYIKDNNISVLSVEDIEYNIESVINAVRKKSNSNLYVHIDLDVLEPEEFPYVPVPVNGGLTKNTLLQLLGRLQAEFKILGMGLLEYNAFGIEQNIIIEEIIQIGSNLQM